MKDNIYPSIPHDKPALQDCPAVIAEYGILMRKLEKQVHLLSVKIINLEKRLKENRL